MAKLPLQKATVDELIWEKYFLGSYVSSPFQILKNNRSVRKSCDAWVIFYRGKPIAGRRTLKDAKEFCENYKETSE